MFKTCIKHTKQLEFVCMENFKLGCSHCVVYQDLKGKKVVDFSTFENEAREKGLVKKSLDKAKDTLEGLEFARKSLNSQSNSSIECTRKILELHLARCHRLLEVEGTRLLSHLKELEEEKIKLTEQLLTKIGLKIEKIGRLMEASEWADSDKFNLVLLLEEMEKIGANDDVFYEVKGLKKPSVIIDQTILSSIKSHISISLEDVLAPNNDFVRQSQDSFKTLMSDLLERLHDEDMSREENKLVSTHLSGVENVVLRYVLSPENFFVMRTRDWQVENRLDEMMVNVWNVGEKGKVKQGDMAVFKESEKYRRVKVISIENDQAFATFLDFGSTTHLPLSSIVNLSSHLATFLSTCPSLAHHCALDIVDSCPFWSDKAARSIELFFGGQVCKLTVTGRRATIIQSTMIVNITREEDENTVSLLDYLVYKDLATRQKGGDEEKLIRPGKRFFHPPIIKPGTEHSVVVQQVDNLGKIHVILMGENNTYEDYMNCMLKDIQVVYTEELVEEQIILMPRVGMVCIAKFSGDDKFYRASVIKLIKNRKVRVKFVDYGNSEVVEAVDLRKIMDKYLVLPIMAVEVALDINQVGITWSEEATQFVREKVTNRIMRMIVTQKRKKDRCKVMMYERKQNDSVNYQLIQEGYGITTEFIKNEDLGLKKDQLDFGNNILSQNPQVDTVRGVRTAYRVISAISPAKMNLRRLDQEESFYELSSSLASYYNYSSVPAFSGYWQIGSYGVVRWDGEGLVRAKVLNRGLEGIVELELIDYGVRDMKTLELMRPLADPFCMPPYSCTVHLAKLLPAGGGDTWTLTACEKLQDILWRTSMEVEIEVVGDIVDNSWPVVLYIQEKDDNAGPLDPLVYLYKSVGDLLVEDGLAFPPRMETVDSVAKMIVLEVIDKVVKTSSCYNIYSKKGLHIDLLVLV